MPMFPLKLQKTYYDKGFFNVSVDYDRYVRNGEGAVLLQLGKGGAKIHAKVNRSANAYGTARIMGGIALRNWFFKNFKPMDNVNVDLSSTEIIVLEGSRTLGAAMDGASAKSPRPIAKLGRPKVSEEKSDEPLPPELQPAMPVEVPSLDVTKDILEFTRRLTSGEIEIYNEFSLQHELGVFLRGRIPACKVQFERNVSHFDLAKQAFEKREIDVTIIDTVSGRPIGAIELKYPRSGQVPETMFSFCKDILFLEQLVASGFGKGVGGADEINNCGRYGV